MRRLPQRERVSVGCEVAEREASSVGRPPGARWRNGESRSACGRAAGRWVIELNGTERGVAAEGSGLAESGGGAGRGRSRWRTR